MLSISSLIEFLLGLLRDEDAQAEFARDPQAVLARHGLEGVTAQDIRDVQPMLADRDGVSARLYQREDGHDSGSRHQGIDDRGYRYHGDQGSGHGYDHPSHDEDPVREIHHVTNTYQVDRGVVIEDHTTQNTYNEYKQYNEYNEYNEYNYDDHSVTTGDGSTVIQDSFNQDNDGVDNKGGVIDDSTVAGGDQDTVGNTEKSTTVEESFNEDSSETVVAVDSNNDSSDNSTTVEGSFNDSSNSAAVNGSYDADAPAAAVHASDGEMVSADSAVS